MCNFCTQGFRLKRSAWQDRRINLAKFASARRGLIRLARLPKTMAAEPPRQGSRRPWPRSRRGKAPEDQGSRRPRPRPRSRRRQFIPVAFASANDDIGYCELLPRFCLFLDALGPSGTCPHSQSRQLFFVSQPETHGYHLHSVAQEAACLRVWTQAVGLRNEITTADIGGHTDW